MEMDFLRSGWVTERCTVALAQETDLEVVAGIFLDNMEAVLSQGANREPREIASALLQHQSLPPNGDPAREHAFLIRDKESGQTAGLLAVYCGYPSAKTSYIGSLYLGRKWQRRGLGRETVGALERRVRVNGYDEVRVAVGLRNWAALRFWVAQGYDRVTLIAGDETFASSAYADIELAKRIDGGRSLG